MPADSRACGLAALRVRAGDPCSYGRRASIAGASTRAVYSFAFGCAKRALPEEPDLIIQRYLYREILQAFVAVLSVLMLVAASAMAVRLLGEAVAGVISSRLVLELVLLKLTGKLLILLPAAVYLGVLIAFGRLYRDSEMVALWAGGVGMRRVLGSMLWFLLGFAVVAGVVALYVSPHAMNARETLRAKAKEESEMSALLPGRFVELRDGKLVAYVQSAAGDGRSMEKAFAQWSDGAQQDVVVAERAYFTEPDETGARFVVLEDGYRYSGAPGRLDYVVYRFERHAIRIERGRVEALRKLETLETSELLRRNHPAYKGELQWRVSQPIATVLLGLLAVPLARASPREGRYARVVVGVAIYFVYVNALGIAQSLIEREQLAALIGVWPVHGVLAVVVATLVLGQSSRGWALRARLRRRHANA